MAEGISRTLGILRPRTQAFREFQKARKLSSPSHEFGRLLIGAVRSDNSPVDNLTVEEAPQWTETYARTKNLLGDIDKELNKLKSAQQQRLQMAFGDVKTKDREIATLSSTVTSMLRQAQSFIQSISADTQSPEQVLENLQHELAARLQCLTQRHRAQQRTFMDKVGKVEIGEDFDPVETPDMDESGEGIDAFDSLSLDRSESVQKLIENLKELASLFEDLASLVLKQGSLLDRIDYNLEEAAEQTGQAVDQLAKANAHQQTMRATGCILALVMLIVVFVLALIFKNF